MGSVKKRGRPVGSKNKPKTVKLTQAQVNVAKKLGVSVEQFAKERAALERKPRGKAKVVDWEKLCKHLQTALRDEFADNDKLTTKIKELEFKVANLEHQAIGYRAVVSYLENKLGNDTV